jgi:hypothetical protein
VVTLRKIEADERRPSRQVAAAQRDLFVRVTRGELRVNLLDEA